MYRPPDGSPKYVEIRNVSGRFLNLRDFELRRAEGASSGGGSVSGMDLPAEPGEYVVITESLEEMKASFGTGPWHEMSHFPGRSEERRVGKAWRQGGMGGKRRMKSHNDRLGEW